MTQCNGREVIMYYDQLAITGSKLRPGERYYAYNLGNAPYDTFFAIEKQDEQWMLYRVQDDPLAWEWEETASLVDCLDWCLEWFEETFVEYFLGHMSELYVNPKRRYITTQFYQVVFEENKDETWEFTVEERGGNTIFRRSNYSNSHQAKRAFAHWVWKTKSRCVTSFLVQQFVDELAEHVAQTIDARHDSFYRLQDDAGTYQYMTYFQYPIQVDEWSGWVYKKWSEEEGIFDARPRLYETKEEVFRRIARDIGHNGTEAEFGFQTFFEWLDEAAQIGKYK